jgi:hypothetical protein
MNLKSILSFNRNKDVLVCATDGFSLTGAIFRRAGSDIHLMYETKAVNTDMVEALSDVISDLKQNGWQISRAVLLSPAVLNTVIELPVNPKKPRSLKQMTELVHWEVEPLLQQHTTRWSVGQLLVGRGYLSADKAQAVMDLQQGNHNEAGGLALTESYSFRKFGELAQELGFIRGSQLKAVLAGQEWLKCEDEFVEYGWHGQGEVPDVPGMYYWHISAVNKSLFERWSRLFAQHQVRLDGMYPLLGASLGYQGHDLENDAVIEVHDNMVYVAEYHQQSLQHVNTQFIEPDDVINTLVDMVNSLPTSTDKRVWLVNVSDHYDDIDKSLDGLTEISLLNVPRNHQLDSKSALLLGAAHQQLLPSSAQCLVMIREGGPLPPVIQRVEVRAVIVLAVMLSLVATSETFLQLNEHEIVEFKTDIDSRWKTVEQAKRAIAEQQVQIEKRQTLLKAQQKERDNAKATMTFFAHDLPSRNALVKGLLGSLAESVPDDVMLISIDELGKRVPMYAPTAPLNTQDANLVEVENFNLRAWAVDEASAQSFIQIIEESVGHLELSVRDPVVREEQGPLSLPGYTIGLRLTKLVDKATL